jgi:hypothetical protein
LLRREYGEDSYIVFIGPCIAKKQEILPQVARAVDAAMTFPEMREWLEEAGIGFLLPPIPFEPSPARQRAPLSSGGGPRGNGEHGYDILTSHVEPTWASMPASCAAWHPRRQDPGLHGGADGLEGGCINARHEGR